MARIAFITCDDMTGIAPDDRCLAAELESIGHDVEAVSWADRPRQQRCDVHVLRSAWDVWRDETKYTEYVGWLEWAERELFLLNPPSVAAWSLNKLCIADLSIPGVRVPTTVRVQRSTSIAGLMREHGWSHAVELVTVTIPADLTSAILDAVPTGWLYLRVDVVIDNDKVTLLEIETGDPKLWLSLAPLTTTALANAIDGAVSERFHTARRPAAESVSSSADEVRTI